MKVCIYGAGAIGGWIGAKLARAGSAINVVARGATLEALKRDGLTLASGDARVTVPVNASADPSALGVQDLVVVAVKAPSLPAVAQQIAPLLGPDTIVLTAMNGVPWWFLQGGFGGPLAGAQLEAVDPGGRIDAAIPARHVIGCVVHASCALDAPGVVRHHFGNGLIIGEPSGEATPRARALRDLLAGAGIDTQLSPQIQKDVWYKLWGNMTVNPISLLTGATTDLILGDDLVRGFISTIMLEAKEVGARIGVPIADTPEDRHAVTRKLGAFKTSMLVDAERGRPIELDAIVGAVAELGDMVGVDTPMVDAIYALTRRKAVAAGILR